MAHHADTAPENMPAAQAVHHEKRSIDNSAAFVLPTIKRMAQVNPKLKILDVGAGSGTITAGFAHLVPEAQVIGIDANPEILPRARAITQDLSNIEFQQGDGHKLPFADAAFDVVFCHQVLVWTPRPWEVLAEMLRVVKPGGVVAAREADFETDAVWPKYPILQQKYHQMVAGAMLAGGGSVTGGRQLVSWALKAKAVRSQIALSFSTWSYCLPEERETWSQGLIKICREGRIRDHALKTGVVRRADLDEMVEAWQEWAEVDDASVAMMHGEIIVRK